MQAKKTNTEKTKNPEMLTLDSTYRIGNRSERSDFDGKGVSACLYVMARKQPRLHCGVVVIAPLFREKHRGAPTVRLDTPLPSKSERSERRRQ